MKFEESKRKMKKQSSSCNGHKPKTVVIRFSARAEDFKVSHSKFDQYILYYILSKQQNIVHFDQGVI